MSPWTACCRTGFVEGCCDYASCQGLTLHNRVRLDLESCHLTLRHLYVGASRATSSELLEA